MRKASLQQVGQRIRPVLCARRGGLTTFCEQGRSIWGVRGACQGSLQTKTESQNYVKIEPAVPRKELLPVATQQTRCHACPDRPTARVPYPSKGALAACKIYGVALCGVSVVSISRISFHQLAPINRLGGRDAKK